MKILRAPLMTAIIIGLLFSGCASYKNTATKTPTNTNPISEKVADKSTTNTVPDTTPVNDNLATEKGFTGPTDSAIPSPPGGPTNSAISAPTGSPTVLPPAPPKEPELSLAQPQSEEVARRAAPESAKPEPAKTSATAGKEYDKSDKKRLDDGEYRKQPPETKTKNNKDLSANREGYTDYGVNQMIATQQDRFSTFAIDVDTASYTIARRKLTEGQLPPQAAVRVEEFVNYFKYRYPQPNGERPLSINIDGAPSPFNSQRHLLRVGLQGKQIPAQQRQPAHLTFLVDVSGSMNTPDRLGMVKRSLHILLENLKPGDTVALTTYAGRVQLILPPTGIEEKERIESAIDQLVSGGSTAMASGIMLAYQQAHANLKPGTINRVIICSDGDANVGNTSPTEILKTIEGYARQGITVSTIGFGNGNYQDAMMEQFADKGNGNYYYIDNIAQAKRVFAEQLTGTLQVIAKDVKVQLEFNPLAVSGYRLIGYENRDVADEDFRKDHIDGGELGAGHTVTALYELILKPQAQAAIDNIVTVRVRYKAPNEDQSREMEQKFSPRQLLQSFSQASDDFRFATSVAAFAEILRNSHEARQWSLSTVASIAQSAARTPERAEMVDLISKAQRLK